MESSDDNSSTREKISSFNLNLCSHLDIEFLKNVRSSKSFKDLNVYAHNEKPVEGNKIYRTIEYDFNSIPIAISSKLPITDSPENIKTPPFSPADRSTIEKQTCNCNDILYIEGGEKQECEMVDSVYRKSRLCTEFAYSNSLFKIHSRLPYTVMCKKHIKAMKLHHCCTICGQNCILGKFYICKENHFTHFHCADELKINICEHCNGKFEKKELIDLKHCNDDVRIDISKRQHNQNLKIKKKAYMISEESRAKIQKAYMQLNFNIHDDKITNAKISSNLHSTIQNNDLSGFLQLIKDGVSLNEVVDNITPLLLAVKNNDIVFIDALLWSGCELNIRDIDGRTAFLIAAKGGDLDIVKLMLNYDACICDLDNDGRTALHMAALSNKIEIVKLLSDLIDVNSEDNCGYTPLMDCSENSFEDIAELLLTKGASPNHADIEGSTSLHWAAFGGSLKLVKLYIKQGCNPKVPNSAGDLPLHIALRQEHFQLAEYLAKIYKMNTRHVNEQGESPYDLLSIENLLLKSIFDNQINYEVIVSNDISNGREKMAIPAFNCVDSETNLTNFFYIVRNYGSTNTLFNEIVSQQRSCDCEFDCNLGCFCSKLHDCYENGKLKDNAIGPIYECSVLCSCWMNHCKNRIVSKGIQYCLEIYRTLDRKWSVRAGQDIPSGGFVCEINGIYSKTPDENSVNLSKQIELYLQTMDAGNVGRFIKRGSNCNLRHIQIFVNQYDKFFPRVALFAVVNIKAGEQLICDFS